MKKDIDYFGDEWISSDRPFADYPNGTKAKAGGGGFWIKNNRGWKWCNSSSTFPRPGGDWTGKVCLPKIKTSDMTDKERLNAEYIGAMVRIAEDIVRMKNEVARLNERIKMNELEMSKLGLLVAN